MDVLIDGVLIKSDCPSSGQPDRLPVKLLPCSFALQEQGVILLLSSAALLQHEHA